MILTYFRANSNYIVRYLLEESYNYKELLSKEMTAYCLVCFDLFYRRNWEYRSPILVLLRGTTFTPSLVFLKGNGQWRRQVSEFGGIGGGHLRGNTLLGGGGGKIEFHEISPPLVAKIFDLLDFFPYIFSEIFSRTFLIFFQTFKNCPDLPKFFSDLPKIFPRPTKNVIFLATFHKFLQFCLSNSDVSTTFGHFSQKSPLCRCGSYTHGSQRLMVSTEIIKNRGGEQNGGAENNFGGHLPPSPLASPLGTAFPEHK